LHLQRLHAPQVLANEIIKSLEMILNYTYGAVLLIDKSGQRLVPFALSIQGKNDEFVTRDKKYLETQNLQMGKGITGWVAQTGMIVRVGDVRQDERYLGVRDNIRSELCVPLIVEDRVIGVINIETDQADAYSQTDESVLETIAAQVSIAIQNSRLFEQIQAQTVELEQRVMERTAQLQTSNKELEAFIYSVSHDLRAPLRAVDGYTRILEEDYKTALDEKAQQVCSVIHNEAQRMGRLIDDLLSLSRLGRSEMYLIPLNMHTMVASIFGELTTPDDRSRMDFRLGALHAAEGDPSLLRQVWINLLQNAIKFTSKKEWAVIEVDSSQDEKETVYTIRDNGAGFDMQYANKLFGVFQRLHSDHEFEGTGVGLAIVQRIIQRHGGRVWAESEADSGASFHFALPRKAGRNGFGQFEPQSVSGDKH